MMRNWLIYRVYHEVIGQADGADYCPLVCDFYLIRTLISLWTLDGSPLRQEDIFALFAMFERWRESENAVLIRQQIQAERSADPALCVFTAVLLTLSGRFSRPYRLRKLSCKPSSKHSSLTA